MMHISVERTPNEKKSIISKAVAFPIALGIIIAFVTVLMLGKSSVVDILQGERLMQYDPSSYTKMGEISFGDSSIDVVNEDCYSALEGNACYKKGAKLGEIGVGYYLVLNNNYDAYGQSSATAVVGDSKHRYKVVCTFSAENENDIYNHNTDVGRGFVLFYQNASDYGFTSQYTAVVYEEVQQP